MLYLPTIFKLFLINPQDLAQYKWLGDGWIVFINVLLFITILWKYTTEYIY